MGSTVDNIKLGKETANYINVVNLYFFKYVLNFRDY